MSGRAAGSERAGAAPWLAIETSTPVGTVAVGRAGVAAVEVRLSPPVRHASATLPAVAYALEAAGVGRDELGGVVIGGGPGSFTGLRIAAATAKGLVHSLGVPLRSYSGLLALAAGWRGAGRPVCGLFDARRGQVYAGCWSFGAGGVGDALLEPWVGPLEEVVARLAPHAPLYVGEGVAANRERLVELGAGLAGAAEQAPAASSLLWLAEVEAEAGLVQEPAHWEPDYVRASSAERGVAG